MLERVRRVWMKRAEAIGLGALVINAGTLVGTTGVTAGLGVVYWWLAARSFSPADVGLASAVISATLLLGTLSVLGSGTLLIGELPRQGPLERRRLVVTAGVVAGLAGGILGVLFALLAPALSGDFRMLGAGPGYVAVVALTIGMTAVGVVVDNALIGILRGDLHLARNALFAIVKLGALVVVTMLPVRQDALAIYVTWLVGILVSFAVLVPQTRLGRWPASAYRPDWQVLRQLGRTALEHHVLNTSLQLPALVQPVLVIVVLSATMNAYFYMASMLTSALWVVPTALTTTLYAIGAHAPATLARRTRFTLALSLAAAIGAGGFLVLAGRPLLTLFGRNYADEVDPILHVVVLGVLPGVIKIHYVAVSQVRGQVRRAAVVVALAAGCELAAAAVGANLGGLYGLVVARLVVLCLEALCMAPVVLRAVAPHGLSPGTVFTRA
jgi:O-antigen/teichoic acid export membrane protein